MSAEDAAEDTIRPRLEAAGANLDRIGEFSHVQVKGEERPVEIPVDLRLLEALIKEHQPKLIIING